LSEFSGNLRLVSVMRPLSGWMGMSFFLLVFGAVRYQGKRKWLAAAIGAGLLYFALTFLAGSRAALFSAVISIAMAGFYARYPHVNWRKFSPFLAFAGLVLLFGVLVFTQFRNLRNNMFGTSKVSVGDTFNLTVTAVQQSVYQPLNQQLSFVGASLIERFVALDMLSITLARADSLKSAERAVGINNNIPKELFLGFVPRMFWADKPLVGEFGLWFTRIYLDIPDALSSNGPTMFGDLFRNFDLLGVLIGMFVVGVYLRILYGGLIQRGIRSPLAPLFYASLYGVFNWEGSYTMFITNGLRALFALATMTALIYVFKGWRTDKKMLAGREEFDATANDR
jgi:oligosaccharide repeat unit polymerase